MPTFTPAREAFRTQLRTAAIELVRDFAEEIDPPISLQSYRARPASINPPCAFVERIREGISAFGPIRQQREPIVELTVLHGVFDSGAAVDAGDRFVDGFLEYVLLRRHAAGGRAIVAITEYEDQPAYVADWIPPDRDRVFYATTFAIKGLILD